MLIIIEGPDLAGKTTLAGRLTEAYGKDKTVLLNYGPPQIADPFTEYETEFIRRLPDDPGTLVICDRLAAGELVYGPVLRGRSRLTRGGLLHCEMLYEALGAVRIMMMPSLAVLLARWRQRGDTLIDSGELAGIREQYAWLAPRFNYLQVTDPGQVMPDDITATLTPEPVLTMARERSDRAEVMQQIIPGYVGSLYPAVILAGDVRSGDPATDPYVHAFTPAAYGAAEFLMEALSAHSRRCLRSTGILNTLEAGMDLRAAAEFAGQPRWIALGKQAAARLAAAGIECETVWHPSFVRRFKKQTPAEYGHALMALAGFIGDQEENVHAITE